MKNLLITTDFSSNAKHAADYGYNLAKQIKANVILCNAVIVPAEMPQAGIVVWPMDEYNVLMDDSEKELKSEKKRLEKIGAPTSFEPKIEMVYETGILTDIIDKIVENHKIDMIIMGTHGAGGFNRFMLGDHSRKMIDCTNKPLLLIPPTAKAVPVKKIAFATDFKQPEKDLESIYNLIPLARLLNTEILLTHVNNEEGQTPEFKIWIDQFLVELSNKANYPHIYYRLIDNMHTEKGLDWLCGHGQVDMLTMVHRKHSFFDNLLRGSHTKKMADQISIPLLVIPENS